MKADKEDLRLEDEASLFACQIITWGYQCHLLIEWPDGVLASAFVPHGLLISAALDRALTDAYDRGRAKLEEIHLRYAQHVGNA